MLKMLMKVIVLYRPRSEFARQVEDFVRGLQTQHGLDDHRLEVLDYDSREGSATASLYDLLAQPSILVIGDDGHYVKDWQGNSLPLLGDVAGYLFNYQ